MRYSVENYFIGFARKFYPNLIYKQIEFRLFLEILNQQKLYHFQKKYFNILQYLSFKKSIKQSKFNLFIYQEIVFTSLSLVSFMQNRLKNPFFQLNIFATVGQFIRPKYNTKSNVTCYV